MQRFRIPIVPYIEQLPYLLVSGLERWVEHGRLFPLCLATLATYLLLVFRR